MPNSYAPSAGLTIDERHGNGDTLITSQFPVSSWHEPVGNPTIAAVFLLGTDQTRRISRSLDDRLNHAAYRIERIGESLR